MITALRSAPCTMLQAVSRPVTQTQACTRVSRSRAVCTQCLNHCISGLLQAQAYTPGVATQCMQRCHRNVRALAHERCIQWRVAGASLTSPTTAAEAHGMRQRQDPDDANLSRTLDALQ